MTMYDLTPIIIDVVLSVTPSSFHTSSHSFLTRSSLLLLRLLEHLLDDLLLLDQESADDAVLDAVGAS